MKYIYSLFLGLVLGSTYAFSQVEFGVKAGLNLTTDGSLSAIRKDNLGDMYHAGIKSRKGYHVGLFSKVKLPIFGFFLQPELYYSFNKETYKNDALGEFPIENNKWAIPVLMGWDFLSFAQLKLGPVFMYNSHQDIQFPGNSNFRKNNKAEIGVQVGAGVVFEKFNLDLRWEKSLSNSYISFSDNINNYRTKSKPSAILISLGYSFL